MRVHGEKVAAGGTHGTEAPQALADVKPGIAEFVAGYSIETTPRDVIAGALPLRLLARETDVYIAHPPAATLHDVVKAAAMVQGAGYNAVPHLLARGILGADQLEDTLRRLQQAGVSRILVIAGDAADPNRAFDSTLEIFYTGMLERYGFGHIGFAGHPEGNRSVGPSLLKQALLDKLAYAAQSPSRFYLLTQFGFDASAVIAYEQYVRSLGYDIPVHVGMAGLAGLKQLLLYAARCGVRSSLGLLMDRSDIIRGVATSAPDRLIRQFAEYRLAERRCLFARAHFFAFGSFELTVSWANSVAASDFELAGDTGFDIPARP